MDETSEKMEEMLLPGFRFHPTDEELVGFYLKRKIQHRPLTIELIKQLDIYKYDPWDLPKVATTTGEKEWYFYCPRDRKYRNSTRPNRVTGAGFWKATGTDRPIYSSEGGSKCIGLKKSLVFYKGRAAKGAKTDWMMHEFRLPSLSDPKRFSDKTIPQNDLWAICRIFKKTTSTPHTALSQSWVSPLPQTTVATCTTRHHFDTSSSFTTKPNVSPILLDPCSSYYTNQSNTQYLPRNGLETFMFPSSDSAPPSTTVDASSMLLNMSSSVLGDFEITEEQFRGSYSSSQDHRHCNGTNGLSVSSSEEINVHDDEQQWIGFPVSDLSHHEAWKSSLVWDAYNSSPCPTTPTEISITYPSITHCYT